MAGILKFYQLTDLNGNPIDLDYLDKAANTEENPQSSPNLAAETDVDNPNHSDEELLAEFNKEKLRWKINENLMMGAQPIIFA